jgi:transglutaminase-like putative cysteine protease
MRIHVMHRTAYGYATPAKHVVQILRLSPRSHDGQHVRNWRIEIDQDCRLNESADAFGNIVHNFTLTGNIESLTVAVEGEIESEDTAGVVRGSVERFPPQLYLRSTALTAPDPALHGLAASVAGSTDRLSLLHDLAGILQSRMKFDVGRTDAGTSAARAFALGHGVCQDFAHIFIVTARLLGVPARYVGGYLVQQSGEVQQDAGHAWAEAYVNDLGWVGFDPTNGVCVTDAYARVAMGLDYLGAAPVRGAQTGGTDESLGIAVTVQDVAAQQ